MLRIVQAHHQLVQRGLQRLAILVLTAVNYVGLREGVRVKNALTVLRIVAVVALVTLAPLPLLLNTLAKRPMESLIGPALLAAGVPAYWWWRRHLVGDSAQES